jgi:serine/threonine protein kinase
LRDRPSDVRRRLWPGATLYFLLTGQPPYVGDPGQRRALVPLRQLRPETPLDLEAVVCQMMARDPSDRYPTPLAVLVALNQFRDPPGSRGQLGGGPREHELSQVQDALLFAMARMAEIRGLETEAHLLRMQQYVRVLAETAMRQPAFAGRIDAAFIRMLERCVVLQ